VLAIRRLTSRQAWQRALFRAISAAGPQADEHFNEGAINLSFEFRYDT